MMYELVSLENVAKYAQTARGYGILFFVIGLSSLFLGTTFLVSQWFMGLPFCFMGVTLVLWSLGCFAKMDYWNTMYRLGKALKVKHI